MPDIPPPSEPIEHRSPRELNTQLRNLYQQIPIKLLPSDTSPENRGQELVQKYFRRKRSEHRHTFEKSVKETLNQSPTTHTFQLVLGQCFNDVYMEGRTYVTSKRNDTQRTVEEITHFHSSPKKNLADLPEGALALFDNEVNDLTKPYSEGIFNPYGAQDADIKLFKMIQSRLLSHAINSEDTEDLDDVDQGSSNQLDISAALSGGNLGQLKRLTDIWRKEIKEKHGSDSLE